MGLLGVANREGGYSCDQQEDLEAIAPAVMQVLQRRKAELERKQAEEERLRLLDVIQQEKYRLSSLIDNLTDEVWFADSKENFTFVNSAGRRVFGSMTMKKLT